MRPVQLFGQAIVPPAAQDLVLRSPQPPGMDLHGGACVIVQPADDERVFHVGDAQDAEELFDFLEVRAAGIVEVLCDARRPRCDLVAAGLLALQDPQGVHLQPPLAVCAQLIAVRPEIGAQGFHICWPAHRIADAVQPDLHLGKAQRLYQPDGQAEDFDIGRRSRRAQHLRSELVVHAKAALLRPVIAEHRGDVVEAHRLRQRAHAVLEVGAHDACGSFRTQREAPPAAVGEGVHLFLDDVRRLAGGTLKDLGVLHDRRADLPVSVAGGKFSDQRLQRLPLRRVVGKDVVNSARRLHRRNWASRRWCRL